MDYLKVGAMVLILLDHSFYMVGLYSLIDYGIIMGLVGSYIFFFASGFLAGHNVGGTLNGWKYLWGKIVRLYPLYFIAVLISIPAMPWLYQQGWPAIFLTLRQIYVPMDMGPWWFVATVFLAYALFVLYKNHRWLFWAAFIIIGQQLVAIGSYHIVVCVALFFMGAESKWIKSLKFPTAKSVQVLSNSTYPLYLFHPLVWYVLLSIYSNTTVFYLAYFPLMIILSIVIQTNYNRIVDYVKKLVTKAREGQSPGSKQTSE